jgi:hypothetical protein
MGFAGITQSQFNGHTPLLSCHVPYPLQWAKIGMKDGPANREHQFLKNGWCRFSYDPDLAHWVRQTLPEARRAARAPEHAHWLRCGGTWFVGVNALANDALGAVGNGPPLRGAALDFIRNDLGMKEFTWDHAQLSVCYPGYPRPMASESDAAFLYRRDRDAAHVDGLLPEGLARRRHLREHHGFILGIPMVDTNPDASPFVIWEGSHHIMRESFRARLDGIPPEQWRDTDLTDIYHATRRRIFDTCRRIEVVAQPGEAYLAHRLALHGMAPWRAPSTGFPDGRMVCYFRPEIGGPLNWLTDP